MNCPNCGKPMEEGAMYNAPAAGFAWVPSSQKRPLLFTDEAIIKCNGIWLREKNFFPPTLVKLTVFICRDCQKGVFDY